MSWKHDDHVTARVFLLIAGPAFVLTNYTFYLIVRQVALCVMTACICATVLGVTYFLTMHREASRGLYRPGLPRPERSKIRSARQRPAVEQRPAVTLVESRKVGELPRGKVRR